MLQTITHIIGFAVVASIIACPILFLLCIIADGRNHR